MFNTARLKLTAWYLLIITAICLLFSAVIYRILVMEVERFARAEQMRFQRKVETFTLPQINHDFTFNQSLVNETKERVLFSLIYLNGGIILISGGLGYWLAGRTLKPIKIMVEEQRRFISDASHELRTPLTALKSSLEVSVRDKNLTLDGARQLISENIADVNRMKLLTDALLTLTSFEKPGSKQRMMHVSTKEIIQGAVRTMEPLAAENDIKIIAKLGDHHINGDPDSLSEMITILLDNAIKYGRGGTSIVVQTKKQRGGVVVSVKDRGVGIKKNDLPHIFDRFFRAEDSRSRGGYGLGLPIAKKIVEIHKGLIWAESISGKGTTFYVSLPRNRK